MDSGLWIVQDYVNTNRRASRWAMGTCIEKGWIGAVCARRKVERVEGIEPSSIAWEAIVLPINYTRFRSRHFYQNTPVMRSPAVQKGLSATCSPGHYKG